MSLNVRKAAVLGAGVMGAQIAAHLANVGIPVLLLDIVPNKLLPEEEAKGLTSSDSSVRNRLAARGLAAAKKAKPAAFYDVADESLVTIGNMQDHFSLLKDCDWVIEAVVERLDIKREVLAKLATVLPEHAIVSTNTSGISLASMVEGFEPSFRKRFLGTHFFNPPRYMKLLEIIPGPDTDAQLIEDMRYFGERRLGKGVVLAKDTPNFIANRIGTYGLIATLQAMETYGLGVDEVDALTGPVIGRPKSATFRTLDLVGLDTFVHVAKNVQQSVSDEAEQARFAIPTYLHRMVENQWLGEKTGQGFFKRERTDKGKGILALDLATLTYRPRRKVAFATLEAAKQAKGLHEKLRTLVYGKDTASQFVWEITKRALLYTAQRQFEIADDIVAVDQAMKWGFNWELGPYEMWDAIGVEKSVARMRDEGETIPDFVEQLLAAGKKTFYEQALPGQTRFYVGKSDYRTIEKPQEKLSLADMKAANGVIRKNSGASLVDIGDGIACLEMHSLNQAIGSDVVSMMQYAAKEVAANWDGLVLYNEAKNFCVGANLMLMLMEAQDDNWDELDFIVRQFHQAGMELKYLAKPVVSAPHAMALGGGAELCFPADAVQAYAESYIGLVEVGVGLIPGGGGTKEMLLRALEHVPAGVDIRPDDYIRRAFETIAMAKVSTSAKDAKRLGYLRQSDGISVNRDYQLYDAKQVALSLARTGYVPRQSKAVKVVGRDGAAMLKSGVYGMLQGGFISEHDAKIANQLIRVLTGGDVVRGTEVTEEYLLDLEREAFLSLMGEPKSQQRMQYMLTNGKPLRN
ncbi:3-hydroxyacyl-CoA dehydrogenase NAD-binding domain-containing protein [Alicyclobacillus fastidiosus]|uniref:3-hydroxyacyl-CoA dehydrogenase NAD-binding domain-containing protein n=1 Tax=Alicyclobacillus fastidiosus TaxID=392011 RepID=A0ABY6ZDH6_9BACL|nr:3-hydroxyacyl-CoA dehydrogenase NAD-binding domain-containing protein [Alicyclobacillus fastidiosus]WAH40795.1 3-hydroxyacyl-CoA dehydrogenase NAD-binding domain-containing protein [Alicyclobacillus fastidiosus]